MRSIRVGYRIDQAFHQPIIARSVFHLSTAFGPAGAVAKRCRQRVPTAIGAGRLDGFDGAPVHLICRVEIQSICAVATGSMARLSHQATSSPKL